MQRNENPDCGEIHPGCGGDRPSCGGCHEHKICERSTNPMNCLCDIFDDCYIWIIILIIVFLFCFCNNCN